MKENGSFCNTKTAKHFANKTVRNEEDLPLKGKLYKKAFLAYNIHKHVSRWTWDDAKTWYENLDSHDRMKRRYPTLKAFRRWWLGIYKIK